MAVNLDNRTYKQLQELAKSCDIPANIRKEQLLKAIKAHYEKDEKVLQGVLNEVKTARAKRKKAKSNIARSRRKPQDKSFLNGGGDDNVDSTSGGLKDLVYNPYIYNSNRQSDGLEQYYSDRLYGRQHSAYLDGAGQYDARLANQLQSNYMESSTAMLQYKDSLSSYPEYNALNYPSYHASSYYPQPCPSFSWMDNPNSYYSMHDSYYQLPATKLFDPKVVDSTKAYSASKNGYYGAESNGISPTKMDCSMISQLETSHASAASTSSGWNQNSAPPNYPNRIQFSSTEMCPYQQDELPDFLAGDNESISAEVDSGSEVDTRSLADDIADLMSMENMEQESAAMNLLMSSETSRGEQSSSTLRNEQPYFSSSDCGQYANASTNQAPETATWQSSQMVEKADETVALPGSQTLQIESDGYQLPTFSAVWRESNASTTDQNGMYSDYQSESGYGGTDCTMSSIHNGASSVEPTVDTSNREDQAKNEYSEIIDLDASPEAPTKDAPAWSPPSNTITNRAVDILKGREETETCDDDVEIVEPQPSTVPSTSLVPRNGSDGQISEASKLIYKKEMLHRSKIICDSTAVVRKYVKIFNLSEGKKTIFSQTTTRKKISDKVPSSNSNALQLQILRAQLETQTKTQTQTRACWYKSVGCAFEAKAQVIATHEKKCKFQTVYCPSESCSWREAFHGLIEHIQDAHKDQILDRKSFLYTIDRMSNKNDRSFYTFYQIHKAIIYVIRVHIDEDKCVATVQYIPDVNGTCIRVRNLRGIMEFVAFPEKRRVKSWKGYIQPYSDTVDKRHTFNTMRIEVGDTEFIALYVCIC